MSEVAVPLDGGATTARLYPAASPSGIALVLAPGAGAPQTHPFMVRTAGAIAARGVDVATFDFRYLHEKKRRPDPPAALEACWRAALATLRAHPLLDGKRVAIGGKSMGGRFATRIAAQGVEGVFALVLLGYPLHPPDRPDELRVEHLPRVRLPALFLQGERDPFGSPDELRPHLPPGATLEAVPRADHSFAVPKRGAPAQAEVDTRVHDTIVAWLRALAAPR